MLGKCFPLILGNTNNSLKQALSVTQKLCQRCTQTATKSTSRYAKPPPKKGVRRGGYIMTFIPVAAFALGTWQVERRKWKLDLIADLEKRTHAAPVPLPNDLEELTEMEYRRVVLKGKFDHSKELYMHPRSCIEEGDQPASGFGVKPKSGAWIITPFQLSDTNKRILVNRGWVPREKFNPKYRHEGQVEGEVELSGIVRKSEKRPQFGAHNNEHQNQWFNRDLEAMAETLNTEEVFIDADRKSSVTGGPIGGQTRVTLRNEHLSYIFTWYSLASITSYMWFTRYWIR